MRWYLRRPARRLRFIEQGDDSLDDVEFKLMLGQTNDRTTCQHGFEILLGIFGVARASVVPATAGQENFAPDIYERAARQTGKISAPSPESMKLHLPLQRRLLDGWARSTI